MFFLLLIFFSLIGTQFDPYSNFAQVTNRLMATEKSANTCADAHRLTDNTLILYVVGNDNPTFLKLHHNGDILNKIICNVAYSPPYFPTPQICWDDNQFIIPAIDNAGNGILQCYDYDFTLINSFGGNNNGTTTALDSFLFTTVTKIGSYYYVGGLKNGKSTIARFNLDGTLDTTFNSTDNTGGYIVSDSLYGHVLNISYFSDTIIFITEHNILAAIPINSGTLNATPPSIEIPPYKIGYQGLISNIEPYDNSSFFVATGPIIYKYTYDSNTHTLALDTSFNQTGSITFSKISTVLANSDNWYPIFSIKKVGNFLYAAGEYFTGDSYHPWITCYTISNTTFPYLEPSFFGQGYFTPLWYPGVSWGAQHILPISNNLHSFFITGGQLVEYVVPSTTSITPYKESSSAPIKDVSHPYNSFAHLTNNTLLLQRSKSFSNHFQLPTKDIIIPYDNSLKLIDTHGNFIKSVNTIPIFSIYYDTNKIIVAGYTVDTEHGNIGRGAMQFFDYTLQEITSFGDFDGTSTISDPTYTDNLEIKAVTRVGNYYYAGGDLGNGFYPLIARFNVGDGKLDTTFNSTGNTPGYYLYTEFSGQTQSILPLAHVLILFTTLNQLLVFSYNDFSTPITTLQFDTDAIFTNLVPYDNSSFFIATNTTIYKYIYSNSTLTLDTTFNKTGSLSFNISTTTILNSVQFYDNISFSTLTKNNNHLFVVGNYKSAHTSMQSASSFSTYHPFILCYNLSNMATPVLDPVFFTTGYYSPSWPQNTPHGVEQLWITNETIPSMFLEGHSFIKKVSIDDTFIRKNIIPKTIAARIQFEQVQGEKIIPLLQ